ncbi:hypothetical protein AKO1_015842 [Acrasis kona]|uniref:Uncharacterized protein n=1 Tax=Acrasis kona TaxID=1008807 RepID=A0AAW2ZIU2_9EUKA
MLGSVDSDVTQYGSQLIDVKNQIVSEGYTYFTDGSLISDLTTEKFYICVSLVNLEVGSRRDGKQSSKNASISVVYYGSQNLGTSGALKPKPSSSPLVTNYTGMIVGIVLGVVFGCCLLAFIIMAIVLVVIGCVRKRKPDIEEQEQYTTVPSPSSSPIELVEVVKVDQELEESVLIPEEVYNIPQPEEVISPPSSPQIPHDEPLLQIENINVHVESSPPVLVDPIVPEPVQEEEEVESEEPEPIVKSDLQIASALVSAVGDEREEILSAMMEFESIVIDEPVVIQDSEPTVEPVVIQDIEPIVEPVPSVDVQKSQLVLDVEKNLQDMNQEAKMVLEDMKVNMERSRGEVSKIKQVTLSEILAGNGEGVNTSVMRSVLLLMGVPISSLVDWNHVKREAKKGKGLLKRVLEFDATSDDMSNDNFSLAREEIDGLSYTECLMKGSLPVAILWSFIDVSLDLRRKSESLIEMSKK